MVHTDRSAAKVLTQRQHQPATLGRRVAARALDVVLGTVLGILVPYGFAAAVVAGGPSWLLALMLGVPVVYAVVGIVVLVRFAATPGQASLGLYHVDAISGHRAAGKTFLKLVLQSFTFGLWVIITPLTLGERNRSWFDRTAQVVVLDSHAPSSRASTVEDRRVQVPPDGWHSDGQLTQTRPVDEPASSVPPAERGVSRSPEPSPMIQSVPFDLGRREDTARTPSSQRAASPPATPTRQVRVRDSRPMPTHIDTASPSKAATADQSSSGAVELVLDDGTRVPLDRLIIMGRAPVQRPALGEARLVSVEDPAVSANHVAFGADDGHWVMDLRSSNGTQLIGSGAPAALEPTERVALHPGFRIKLGGRIVSVEESR